MRIFLIWGTLLACLACQSKPPNSTSGLSPAPLALYPQNLGAAPFLSGADNRGAVFSKDQNKIYFISKNRREHRNSQAYEYDLTLKTHRRITFQDGEVLGVAAGPGGTLFYASNTDEIKEDPYAREQDYRFSRADIYQSDLFGDQIDRWTQSPGFDGDMVYLEPRKLLFTSLRTGTPGLYWLNLEDASVTGFQVSKNPQRSPTVSPDGKTLYWIEEDAGTDTQSLVKSSTLGRQRVVLKSLVGKIQGLAVNGQGWIAYAWQPKGAEFLQIDLWNPESDCRRVLLKSAMDFSEPQFPVKTPQVLLFRGALKENSVIYRWELPEALGPCVP